MSRVVLRCPNCGTTQAGPGECEACHEAQVAYYCTNHSPGRWLEAPICPQCGARFGAASPAAETTPTPATRPTPVASVRQPARETAPPSPWTRSAPRRGPSGPVSPPTAPPLPPPVREDPRAAEREAMTRRLRDILMREPAAGRYPEARRPETPGPPPQRNAMVGFIRRLMILVFFFIAAMFLLSLFAGGPLLQILLNILLAS
jgi:hypothetical protein